MAGPVSTMALDQYNDYIEHMRKEQFPMLTDALYLDHAGTTLYSKRLMERFQADMMSSLFGNPHSASPSSQRSTQEVETARITLLRFFNADPEHFDLVFTANATAAIKLVMEAFREQQEGFWYGYHVESHTSIVGVRECATDNRCFGSDEEVDHWIGQSGRSHDVDQLRLFAYPAQSNMNGRRLPLEWCKRLRQLGGQQRTYSMLDAAAYASTSPLDFSNVEAAPDFTALSLYKIFGFPDLGALIVRKDTAPLFQSRRYFGGGTVDMVVCLKEQWHAKKASALHEQLEDGTLPVHSIIALKSALQTHEELFGSLDRVSAHTARLAEELYQRLTSLNHANGRPVCMVYKHARAIYGNVNTQGPIVAFNLCDSRGNWVSNTEVEKLASVKNIHLRTGGVCNPGGIAEALGLAPWEMRENFSAGHRCGGENDVLNGKPTGVIRVSLGAMSTKSDVARFLGFVDEFFWDKAAQPLSARSSATVQTTAVQRFHVESLTVYPIKSCAGWQVPHGAPWPIRNEGLAWDREWCIVHQGTGKGLSQKQHPRMALLRPSLDFNAGVLRVSAPGSGERVAVRLSKDPSYLETADYAHRNASVCGDLIKARLYTSSAVAEFFTKALGVPCTLARFPAASPHSPSLRHSKAHLQQARHKAGVPRPILLSNESPILTISRSSLNRLNEQIKAKGGKAAHPSVFRANIVLAESACLPPGHEQPWAEDAWQSMRVGGEDGPVLEFLGGCRRCQMVCIDQVSGEKNQEPLVTLAKTRRFDGRVLFGVHTALAVEHGGGCSIIKAGDVVEALARSDTFEGVDSAYRKDA
ncbi:hypothetical protein LTR36_007900 [Oleoguttula mirabilis]|uniref:Molybdenum cofactor sulfurase n=1 Tax=Oleoguttula mirabilis TaxID=1507867 RepID=A0AAV9J9U1_9PEZI|nr:hypothetical protein LTR36_007900 [Oleoguttula mirabilis]